MVPVELILLMGIQASGKSTFCRERLFSTHIRLNLDMLRTRHREAILLHACLEAKAKFVIDNTNLTRADRARFIAPARAAHFAVHGFFFESRVADSIARNAGRSGKARVPDSAIRHSSAKLEPPDLAEGFDTLSMVRISAETGEFLVEPWNEERRL